MKTYPTLKLGSVTARLLLRGDSYPCPKKGHPPFTHEREEPSIVLYRAELILRVVPLRAVGTAAPAVFRGNAGRKPWALTESHIAQLIVWAARTAKRRRTATRREEVLRSPTPMRTVKVPEGKEGGPLRRNARTHPGSARGLIDDCDYAHKLAPEVRAWKDQFDRETVLNRWYDKEGVVPFYPRGSEERRKLQFDYNHRTDDLFSNPKEWRPESMDREPIVGDSGRAYRRSLESRVRSLTDILPANNPTEDDLIAAIDRSRE